MSRIWDTDSENQVAGASYVTVAGEMHAKTFIYCFQASNLSETASKQLTGN
jgi:hypothetical protein